MHIIFVGVKKCIYEFCSVLPPFELARGASFPPHTGGVLSFLSSGLTSSSVDSQFSGLQFVFSVGVFKACCYSTLSCNSFNFLFSFINVLVCPIFPRSSNICYILIVIFCFASFSQSSLVHAYFSSKCLKYETKWLIWSACLILIMFAFQLSAHGISRLVVYHFVLCCLVGFPPSVSLRSVRLFQLCTFVCLDP